MEKLTLEQLRDLAEALYPEYGWHIYENSKIRAANRSYFVWFDPLSNKTRLMDVINAVTKKQGCWRFLADRIDSLSRKTPSMDKGNESYSEADAIVYIAYELFVKKKD